MPANKSMHNQKINRNRNRPEAKKKNDYHTTISPLHLYTAAIISEKEEAAHQQRSYRKRKWPSKQRKMKSLKKIISILHEIGFEAGNERKMKLAEKWKSEK